MPSIRVECQMPFVFTLFTVRDKNNESFQYKSKQKPNKKNVNRFKHTHSSTSNGVLAKMILV